MFDPRCARCQQSISANDTLVFEGHQVAHLDCHRPALLSPEERVLLFRYCWEHPVAECAKCHQSFRQHELARNVVDRGELLCSRCRLDLTANVRSHVYGCPLVPPDVRTRAHEARETASRLVKQSHQLTDRSDVLIAEAEAAVAQLRLAMRHTIAG